MKMKERKEKRMPGKNSSALGRSPGRARHSVPTKSRMKHALGRSTLPPFSMVRARRLAVPPPEFEQRRPNEPSRRRRASTTPPAACIKVEVRDRTPSPELLIVDVRHDSWRPVTTTEAPTLPAPSQGSGEPLRIDPLPSLDVTALGLPIRVQNSARVRTRGPRK